MPSGHSHPAPQGMGKKLGAALSGVFPVAQKLVSFNLGYHPDAARLVDFGSLDASQAANLYGPGQSDFMGQR